MLATSPTLVAHVVEKKDTNQGILKEEPMTSYLHRMGIDLSSCFDGGLASNLLAIETAREEINNYNGKPVYYDANSCNSEHWVRHWGLRDLPADFECEARKFHGYNNEVRVNDVANGTGKWKTIFLNKYTCLNFPLFSKWYK